MDGFHKRSDRKQRPVDLGRRLSPEQRKQQKERSRRRKAQRESRGGARRNAWSDEDDDLAGFEKMGRGARAAREDRRADRAAPAPVAGVPALVVGVERHRLTLRVGDGAGTLHVPAPAAETVVGDRVLVERLAAGAARVAARLPRSSSLARPDPAAPERRRVLAANVDLGVVVASARTPPFKPGLVERVLVALAIGGVRGLVCVNKLDLLSAAERDELEARAAPLRAGGVEVLLVSAEDGEGVELLRERVRGLTCVLVGHSGVGKSSLSNRLAPEAGRATGAVRASDGKGRHTTTSSSLIELEDGTRLVDTPGIRAFGLWALTLEDLRAAFPDLAEVAASCRFRDCTHSHEPDCGVRAAVAAGQLDAARYERWVRLVAELEGGASC